MTAMRLVLAAWVGDKFKKVRAGTIIIPPPTPSSEPNVPAPRPIKIRNANKPMLSNNSLESFSMLKKKVAR
ncbi:MAG: hypothetical protein ACJ70N_07515 [Nitrososphaera sp.]